MTIQEISVLINS